MQSEYWALRSSLGSKTDVARHLATFRSALNLELETISENEEKAAKALIDVINGLLVDGRLCHVEGSLRELDVVSVALQPLDDAWGNGHDV